VYKEDQHYLHIVWRDPPIQKLKDYKLTTMDDLLTGANSIQEAKEHVENITSELEKGSTLGNGFPMSQRIKKNNPLKHWVFNGNRLKMHLNSF